MYTIKPILAATCMMASILSVSFSNKKDQVKSYTAPAQVNSKNDKLNISILLDLSDRISPEKHPNPPMEYYKRDLGYIESIAKAFEKHLRAKPTRFDDDYIQVYFEPEPTNSTVNELAGKLKLSFTKEKGNATKENLEKITPLYRSVSNSIYQVSIKNRKYDGSDIWGFFKNKVNDYCIKPNHRNILFILTDGYVFHKDSKFSEGSKTSYVTPAVIASLKLNTPKYQEIIRKNGYGFVRANDNLNALEVFVVGVNPAKGNPFEGDVINTYWINWLKVMKVKGPIMTPISADLPSNLDQVIQKYINPQ